ncbi:hypothetical protein H072_4057 [Dactylellina haptotyla CBS 200.50]|uniref:Myb-like DNA-binding domain-containing protein n=1 Tax=Dactylellina haptotyla (strain CBS 200.50) TaxID=1284197 RepID=S8AG47_DACHA|nr:hypothetical protein H072_4057 [Dactylellina haptotyla CBS 200.50]
MVKGTTNPITDAEFLLCCLESIMDPKIDFSIVSKATGYSTDGGARSRFKSIKATVKSCIREHQKGSKKEETVSNATADDTPKGAETRRKKKVRFTDPEEGVKSEPSTKSANSDEQKRVTRSTTVARGSNKDGKKAA